MLEKGNSEQKTLPTRVADEMVAMIIDGCAKPGERMPGEHELAERLNVGRSTVREAIKCLTSQNILEVRKGSGTFVKEQTGVMEDPFGFRFTKNKFKLGLDLWEIRMMIEPDIAAMAAERATEQDLEQLIKACTKVEELIAAGQEYKEWDIKFHTALAHCTGNSVIHTLVPVINQSIPCFIELTGGKLFQQTIETHRRILDAVCGGNSQAAYDAMVNHLEYNRCEIERIAKEKDREVKTE